MGICAVCSAREGIQDGWVVGERVGPLKRAIDDYKFERAKSAHAVLARMLDKLLPKLDSSTIVTSIPTTPSHIRTRGYDHAALIAKCLARSRRIRYESLIRREATFQQHTSSRSQRLSQVKSAFFVSQPLDESLPYIVVDDIITTGATITAGAKTLRTAGAKRVMVAALARQTLDDTP